MLFRSSFSGRLMLVAALLRCSLAVAMPDGGSVGEGVWPSPELSTSGEPVATDADLELRWVDVPLEADPVTPLDCKPLPKCVVASLSIAMERDLGVWAWNGRGLQPILPRRTYTIAGYVDLARKTWVPLEVNPLLEDEAGRFDDPQLVDVSRLMQLLGHPASPLVAVADVSHDPITVYGFGSNLTSWRIIDVVQRRVRLELTSEEGEVRAIGPGTKVRVRTYLWALPPQCPHGGHRSEPVPYLSRALPSFAVEATWDVVTGKRVTAFEAWYTDPEHGPHRLGTCRLTVR